MTVLVSNRVFWEGDLIKFGGQITMVTSGVCHCGDIYVAGSRLIGGSNKPHYHSTPPPHEEMIGFTVDSKWARESEIISEAP